MKLLLGRGICFFKNVEVQVQILPRPVSSCLPTPDLFTNYPAVQGLTNWAASTLRNEELLL